MAKSSHKKILEWSHRHFSVSLLSNMYCDDCQEQLVLVEYKCSMWLCHLWFKYLVMQLPVWHWTWSLYAHGSLYEEISLQWHNGLIMKNPSLFCTYISQNMQCYWNSWITKLSLWQETKIFRFGVSHASVAENSILVIWHNVVQVVHNIAEDCNAFMLRVMHSWKAVKSFKTWKSFTKWYSISWRNIESK